MCGPWDCMEHHEEDHEVAGHSSQEDAGVAPWDPR